LSQLHNSPFTIRCPAPAGQAKAYVPAAFRYHYNLARSDGQYNGRRLDYLLCHL
jgi:hypothetical protein